MVAPSLRTERSAISSAFTRGSNATDEEVYAVCTVRTCAQVGWLLREFFDRCENTRLDAGTICFRSDPICATRS